MLWCALVSMILMFYFLFSGLRGSWLSPLMKLDLAEAFVATFTSHVAACFNGSLPSVLFYRYLPRFQPWILMQMCMIMSPFVCFFLDPFMFVLRTLFKFTHLMLTHVNNASTPISYSLNFLSGLLKYTTVQLHWIYETCILVGVPGISRAVGNKLPVHSRTTNALLPIEMIWQLWHTCLSGHLYTNYYVTYQDPSDPIAHWHWIPANTLCPPNALLLCSVYLM